jgi:hypothetical protein
MIDRLFDIAICALLVATIAHLALVQHRLRAFRAERDRLQAFVTALDLTVERAESAIRRLRPAAGGDAEPAAAKPREVRERAPEDLLKAARAAAGVDGGRRGREATTSAAGVRRGAGGAGQGGDKRAATLADALQDAVGG